MTAATSWPPEKLLVPPGADRAADSPQSQGQDHGRHQIIHWEADLPPPAERCRLLGAKITRHTADLERFKATKNSGGLGSLCKQIGDSRIISQMSDAIFEAYPGEDSPEYIYRRSIYDRFLREFIDVMEATLMYF